MSKKILNFIIIFLLFSLTYQLFTQKPVEVNPDANPIVFETIKTSYHKGQTVELLVTNNTDKRITFLNECPSEPFTVKYLSGSQPKIIKHDAEIDCEQEKNVDQSVNDLVVNPHTSQRLRYTYWSNSLFSQNGRYNISGTFTIDGETFTTTSNEFTIENRGIFGNIWIGLLYQPIYNFLIGLISVVPGKSLGLAIIILTLIIRGFLFAPSLKAMKSQKKLAEVQPKLNEIREKYKNDQQKLAEETLKIWRQHKVNPLGSCLPLLIQFPILIALFYVIQDGLNPDNAYLLYSSLEGFNFLSIDTIFLHILPLTTKNIWVLPIIVGALQFIQVWLSMSNQRKTQKKGQKKDQAQAVQGAMLYIMPVLIAVFTASLPAGVGLYWGTSTLFGIGQQIYVNKKA